MVSILTYDTVVLINIDEEMIRLMTHFIRPGARVI